jgi:dTDP-4-dehydrorhamnose reductase
MKMGNISTDIRFPYCKPQLWGGIECTINRVGDQFYDQLEVSGHYTRPGDIEKFASAGMCKLRYPVLWERHQPTADDPIDWTWISTQLELIRSHNITPIAGLIHHGSGPSYTDLLDEKFPDKLAAYALQVATSFPWLDHYTPVNEPLTTARFSGMYGYWYPHHTDERSFIKMLLHQVKAVVLSMQAIRTINPNAKLIQTEDLSKTHSTSLLSYQASFENKRRWLTWDLLCGSVDPDHFFWNYFIKNGITEKDLRFFMENKCPPDIMGFNYYITSERYLDENISNYPACSHGGNHRHQYADVEAVRVGKRMGLEPLLKEAWQRYHLPIAITECHLNCTIEEQLRWFKETWDILCELNKEGLDIRAITAWSLIGAFDWNSLLTCRAHFYESGVFAINENSLRPTPLVKLIRSLSETGDYSHSLLSEKGWWHKEEAVLHL